MFLRTEWPSAGRFDWSFLSVQFSLSFWRCPGKNGTLVWITYCILNALENLCILVGCGNWSMIFLKYSHWWNDPDENHSMEWTNYSGIQPEHKAPNGYTASVVMSFRRQCSRRRQDVIWTSCAHWKYGVGLFYHYLVTILFFWQSFGIIVGGRFRHQQYIDYASAVWLTELQP